MRITKNIIPFIDTLFLYLLVFCAIISLLKAKSDNENASYQQQNAIYLVTINWEGNSDIDLWGRDPVGHVVGFPRREGGNGSLMSLNRDCLGASTSEVGPDGKPVNPVNEEIISIRGTLQGEYIFNGHSYALKNAGATKVTAKLIKNKPYQVIAEKTKTFETTGEEQTFFRFSLDKDGNVAGVTDLPANILPAQTQQPAPQEPVLTNPYER